MDGQNYNVNILDNYCKNMANWKCNIKIWRKSLNLRKFEILKLNLKTAQEHNEELEKHKFKVLKAQIIKSTTWKEI